MKNKLLLPNKYKFYGWCLLIPSTIFGIILLFRGFNGFEINVNTFAIFNSEFFKKNEYFTIIKTDISLTLIGSFFIIGSLLVGFSEEKIEDEFISKLRLSSLLWAFWVNYILLLLGIIFVYGIVFFNIMLFNMFTTLIIFIVRFNYVLYKNSLTLNEK